ncbi:3-dehydroquinate dehydratase [uncultured archaeon]|nr:3-dehydroquinate dehydratase [uncultured archaeon]
MILIVLFLHKPYHAVTIFMRCMVHIGDLELNKSVVASIGKNPVDTAAKAKKLGADLLELRIDLLDRDAHQSLKDIKRLGLPVIITNRMQQEGGAWLRGEDERIRTLVSLLPLADAVDIELCAEKRDTVVQKAKRSGKTVIISTHDFQGTPDQDILMEIFRESFEAGADIAKLAVMPASFEDVIRLLKVTLHAPGAVCTIAMGETGRHSRIIAPIYGSVMTYGYVEDITAPGQLRVDELKTVLKIL